MSYSDITGRGIFRYHAETFPTIFIKLRKFLSVWAASILVAFIFPGTSGFGWMVRWGQGSTWDHLSEVSKVTLTGGVSSMLCFVLTLILEPLFDWPGCSGYLNSAGRDFGPPQNPVLRSCIGASVSLFSNSTDNMCRPVTRHSSSMGVSGEVIHCDVRQENTLSYCLQRQKLNGFLNASLYKVFIIFCSYSTPKKEPDKPDIWVNITDPRKLVAFFYLVTNWVWALHVEHQSQPMVLGMIISLAAFASSGCWVTTAVWGRIDHKELHRRCRLQKVQKTWTWRVTRSSLGVDRIQRTQKHGL